jgi:hypothetical protein
VVLDYGFGKTEVRRKWVETISPRNLARLQATKNPALKRRDSYYVAENSYFLAYFFLNLSIRPAVSTSMFFPVKKG